MPHCILEVSDNLPDAPDWADLLADLHGALTGTGLFQEADLKSRVIRHPTFRVGDGAPDRAFAALEVQILEGRDEATKARISEELMAVLVRAFAPSAARRRLSLSVQVSDLHRGSYRRTRLPEIP